MMGADYWLNREAGRFGLALERYVEAVDPAVARAKAAGAIATDLAALAGAVDRQATLGERFLSGLGRRRLMAARIADLTAVVIHGSLARPAGPAAPAAIARTDNGSGHEPLAEAAV